jgi:hypothetical protein
VTTTNTAVMSDADQDIRWREWTAKGAANDRRTAKNMRIVMLLIVVALLAWSYIQLT